MKLIHTKDINVKKFAVSFILNTLSEYISASVLNEYTSYIKTWNIFINRYKIYYISPSNLYNNH